MVTYSLDALAIIPSALNRLRHYWQWQRSLRRLKPAKPEKPEQDHRQDWAAM